MPPRITEEDIRDSESMNVTLAVLPEIEFVTLTPGRFRMGSTPAQIEQVVAIWEDADPRLMEDELPARIVSIPRPLDISRTEITQQQFEAVMGTQPSRFLGSELPVHNVLHEEAVTFCQRLTERTGQTYRLPTEAEWEYAARAGNEGLWCFGDDVADLENFAWFEENALNFQKVGGRAPNEWGIFDMHGNVWEWCADRYGLEEGYVVKGGSVYDSGFLTRSAERDFGPPFRRVNIGFRVVREVAPLDE